MKKSVCVFVASSSEQLPVVEAICENLKAAEKVVLMPHQWDRNTFKTSLTYIESLEEELGTAEYAIFVLTPDDAAKIREQDYKIPRDNVLFEVGLFMGKLERKRCFLVHSADVHGKGDLKLPSDLLGVKTVTYPENNNDLKLALRDACRSISQRIIGLEREKWNSFCGRAAGDWWEFITAPAGIELSFFRVIPDSSYQSVRLEGGEHFNNAGDPIGNWYSTVVGIRPSDRQILYGWQGSHPHGWTGEELAPGKTDAQSVVKGFGSLTFSDAPGAFKRGNGNFIDYIPNKPADTKPKYVELTRIEDAEDIRTLTEGSRREKKTLAKRTLKWWLGR